MAESNSTVRNFLLVINSKPQQLFAYDVWLSQ